MLTRWCLGLKSECTNIIPSLKLLVKLIKENTAESLSDSSSQLEDTSSLVHVSEAERSRIRSVCGNQLIKLAQEPCFKPLITAEYFHALARLIIVNLNQFVR